MTEIITSPQNPAVKLAASLHQKKHRDETGLFLVEGIRAAEELLRASGWTMEFGLYTEAAMKQERAAKVIASASQRCRLIQVSEAVFGKAAETENPQGVMFVVKRREIALNDLLTINKRPLLVVLDSIQDPGNIGTLLRTADAAGADGVIITSGSADPFSGKAQRAGMGSIFHLPVVVEAVQDELLNRLAEHKISLIATALEADSMSYLDANYRQSTAVAFGNEGKGITIQLLTKAEKKVSIPIYGKAESLNVAAAAAVILFEAARQRSGRVFL